MLRFLLAACCCFAAVESSTVINNDSVRVLSVTYPPHEKSILHTHAGNRVVILLDAGNLATKYEDGNIDDRPWKAGEARWVPAGPAHVGENTGSKLLRIVEIEIKNSGPSNPPARNPKLDPVGIDPKHNEFLFENAQVRVFRSWREPGAKEQIHEHTGAGRVAVLLTDIDANIAEAGKTTPLHQRAGEVLWSGPATHAATNIGKKQFDMIIVEVK